MTWKKQSSWPKLVFPILLVVTYLLLSFIFHFHIRLKSGVVFTYSLCVIFKILVSFSRDNALFASKAKINIFWKAKINVFWNFFERSGPEGASGVKKKFQKMLILVFEVIVQPPKTHFLTFSKVQKQKKSETKIMKITHSVKSY